MWRLIKSLDVQAQYTNTLTRNLDDNPGNRVPRMPVDQWSMIISYQPIDPLSVSLEGRYVGSRFNDAGNRQSMPAFDVWNISASYNVTNRVQTYVRVDNIFNEKYEEILLFGTPMRSIFVGLRVNYDCHVMNHMNLPRLVIAGTHSGVGKTTVTLAILAALNSSGPPGAGVQGGAGLYRSWPSQRGDWTAVS